MQVLTVVLLVTLTTLTFLYLALTPEVRKLPPSNPNLTSDVVEKLASLTPPYEQRRIEEVREDVALVSRIVNGLKTDQIACIAPSPAEKRKLERTVKVLLPDSAASGPRADSTAVLGSDRLIKQTNTLLQISKDKRHRVSAHLHQIELTMDTSGDRFQTRFARTKRQLEDDMLQMSSDIVAECAKQKERLRSKYPHLSNYEFIDESINDKTTLSPYTHGTAVTPVTRHSKQFSTLPGLIAEYHEA